MRNGSVALASRRIIDTNLLLYAYDPRDAAKQQRARAVLERAGEIGGSALTSQVLAEFASAAVRRLSPPLTPTGAQIEVAHLSRIFPTISVTPVAIIEALRGVEDYQLSFWDALIWATAQVHGAPLVLTEDLPGGKQAIEQVAYLNPLDPSFDLSRIGPDV